MMKEYIPSIRVVSADCDQTISASTKLTHAMRQHNLHYKIMDVYCYLEVSRCGIPAGKVGIEVDGQFRYIGDEVTDEVAEAFCSGLPGYIEWIKREYGMV